jgi:hypothetical protein
MGKIILFKKAILCKSCNCFIAQKDKIQMVTLYPTGFILFDLENINKKTLFNNWSVHCVGCDLCLGYGYKVGGFYLKGDSIKVAYDF